MNNVPLEPGVPASRGESRYLKVNEMKQVQRGFTLIELVMVIVILGVLAAVAIPKFVDLKGDAQAAASLGVQGALNSANSINYATCSMKTNAAGNTKCSVVGTCSVVGSSLMQPAITIVVGALPAITVDGTVYLVTDSAAAAAGATCSAIYGNGKAAGIAISYTANLTT
jgi:prepilin-type N-terminal cleavage/methylation domain-containing protein